MTDIVGEPAAGFEVDETPEIRAIIAELVEAIEVRGYGQFCGLARALDVVGERWAMLIVRDLLVSPKTSAELRAGLPRIQPDILAARLREFERAGIVRSTRTEPNAEAVYELTGYGRELDDITLRLGRWGARMLGDPRPSEIVTESSLVMAMRATFRPEAAHGVHVTYEIRLDDIALNLRIDDGSLRAAGGPLPGADLSLRPGSALKALLSGELSPAEALAGGEVEAAGDPALLDRFVELFRIG